MNKEISSAISFLDAKELARELAFYDLNIYASEPNLSLLCEYYAEAENCWVFFRNPDILIPPEGALSDFAYCVSKKGAIRSIPDFSKDSVRLHEYLDVMSKYFNERGL